MRRDNKTLHSAQRVLVTGAAGFVGFHLSQALLARGIEVIGCDNLNDYYDPRLKEMRLEILRAQEKFVFHRGDLADKPFLDGLFAQYHPEIVVNLAAQAGVRYSIDNPQAYINSNIVGFFNVLEACRHFPVEHLVYASSSSVYGGNQKVPFSTDDKVDNPVSLYAATKKTNELMANTYSHLYQIPCTGLRFFTVYGPYGRPDMAYFSFTQKILAGKPIQVFNHGDMYRDFTYIDDIIDAVLRILPNPPEDNENGDRCKVYNIGNNHPEKLMDFISTLEQCLGREAQKEYLPMQPGDVYQTYADVHELVDDFGFHPDTPISVGLKQFVEWYHTYESLTVV